jgi:glutamine cyclotransferase
VGTLSSQDGETTIVVTDDAAPVLAANELQVFDGEIDVPGGTLAVTTVFNDVLVTLPVRTGSVALRIWVNHETEPDRIVIAAGSPDGMSRLT